MQNTRGEQLNLHEGIKRLAVFSGVIALFFGCYVSVLISDDAYQDHCNYKISSELLSRPAIQQMKLAQMKDLPPENRIPAGGTLKLNEDGIEDVTFGNNGQIVSMVLDGDNFVTIRTKGASFWECLSVVLTPLLFGMFGWGILRFIGWVIVGFTKRTD